MGAESTATYRIGDLIALARWSWLGQMTSRLERLGYAGYRRGDSAVLPMLWRDPLPVGRLGAGLGVTRQAAERSPTRSSSGATPRPNATRVTRGS